MLDEIASTGEAPLRYAQGNARPRSATGAQARNGSSGRALNPFQASPGRRHRSGQAKHHRAQILDRGRVACEPRGSTRLTTQNAEGKIAILAAEGGWPNGLGQRR
jgi:hypothetical protein